MEDKDETRRNERLGGVRIKGKDEEAIKRKMEERERQEREELCKTRRERDNKRK